LEGHSAGNRWRREGKTWRNRGETQLRNIKSNWTTNNSRKRKHD
jgi:hypothetical protein